MFMIQMALKSQNVYDTEILKNQDIYDIETSQKPKSLLHWRPLKVEMFMTLKASKSQKIHNPKGPQKSKGP